MSKRALGIISKSRVFNGGTSDLPCVHSHFGLK
jgi:hypothetical protein